MIYYRLLSVYIISSIVGIGMLVFFAMQISEYFNILRIDLVELEPKLKLSERALCAVLTEGKLLGLFLTIPDGVTKACSTVK